MTVAATDEHVAFLRGMHGPTGPETSHGGLNVGIAPPCKCGYVWPCSIARLLARLESAEALAVPEGWHIEYGEICGYGGRCRHANRLHAHLLLDSDDDPPARLVPSPPPGEPDEGEGER